MLLPTWLILAILTGLLSNTYNFLNRFLLKGNDDSTAYAWFTEIVRVIGFSAFALFDWKLILTPQSAVIFLTVGLTEFIGGYFYMKMHSYTHLSISTILSRTRLIWVPIFGFFLLKEGLKFTDYIGILIIFIGVSAIMAPKKLFVDKGAMYANLSAILIAINIVVIKMAVPYGSNFVINALQSLPAVILFPLVMKNPTVRLKLFASTKLSLKLLAAGMSILQLFLFLTALKFGEPSKINAVYQGMLIFSVLSGIIFLKERQDIGRKLLGAVITITGVVVLSLY